MGIKSWAGPCSLQGSGEEVSLLVPRCWHLPAVLGVPQLLGWSLQPLLPLSHGHLRLCVPFSPLVKTPLIGFRVHPTSHIDWLHLQSPHCLVRSHSVVTDRNFEGIPFNLVHEVEKES